MCSGRFCFKDKKPENVPLVSYVPRIWCGMTSQVGVATTVDLLREDWQQDFGKYIFAKTIFLINDWST